jgi:hypothetical protein
MTERNPETALRDSTVRELLLSYQLHVEGQLWPGADALTLDDLVRAYPRVAATGRVPRTLFGGALALIGRPGGTDEFLGRRGVGPRLSRRQRRDA